MVMPDMMVGGAGLQWKWEGLSLILLSREAIRREMKE